MLIIVDKILVGAEDNLETLKYTAVIIFMQMVNESLIIHIGIPFIIGFAILFAVSFCLGIYFYILFFKIRMRIKKISPNKKIPFSFFYPLTNYLDTAYIKRLKDKEINSNVDKMQNIWKIHIKLLLTSVVSLVIFPILIYILR